MINKKEKIFEIFFFKKEMKYTIGRNIALFFFLKKINI